jgi:hypothetical protein
MNLVLLQPGESVSLTPEAERLIEDALAPTALIGKVSNTEQQKDTVAAVQAIHDLAALIKESAEEAAKPFYHKWAKIHEVKKQALDRLSQEETRVNRLLGDHLQLEVARIQAANQAANHALTENERARAAERAQATSHEQLDEIDFRYAALNAQQTTTVIAPTVAYGQKAKASWEYKVTDPLKLWSAFPQCVKPSFVDSEIKNLLDIYKGTVPGVEAKSVIVSKVRKSKEQKAIEL